MPNVNLDAQFVRDAVCLEGRGKTESLESQRPFILLVTVRDSRINKHPSLSLSHSSVVLYCTGSDLLREHQQFISERL